MAAVRKRTAKLALAGIACTAVLGMAIWFIVDTIRERQATRLAHTQAQEIVAMLDLAAMPDFHQRLDTIRAFINDHSQHKIDAEFWANQGDMGVFGAGVIAHAKQPSAEPIHMECSTRSNLMGRILRDLGYQTRVVAIFDSQTNLRSHSFLDVMNPATQRWETQDADYDIYWQDTRSKERVSLADAAERVQDIEPCGRQSCGWDHASREGIKASKLKTYLDIISVTDKDRGIRYALYTSRADLAWIYTKGEKRGGFCQVEAKRCSQGFHDLRTFDPHAAP